MNFKKLSAGIISAVMIMTFSACSKTPAEEEKETYNFGGAETLSDVREHFMQAKKITQNFYLTIDETNGDFESFSEFYRIDEEEVRLLRYDGYQTRFIRGKGQYTVIDDVKETAAVYYSANAHDDIMWADMDFIISGIDLALSGQLVETTLKEDKSNADDFELLYKGESSEYYIFRIKEGRLSEMTFTEKSGKIIAQYKIEYGSRGGNKKLFDYEGYRVTNMQLPEETDTQTTEE